MVRAELFPDHTMNITFGSGKESTPKQMFEELVGMLEGYDKLKGKIVPKESDTADKTVPKKNKNSEASEAASDKGENLFQKEEDEKDTYFSDDTMLALECTSLDKVIYLSRLFSEIPLNELYKMGENYYLLMDLSLLSKEKFRPVAFAATEYGCRPLASAKALAHVKEHGKCIIAEDAIEQLRQL